MEMHQIRYFLAVADTLNFTKAAEKCNVAQPSLTRAIKLLEEELGGALFHRERANTHLSELGQMVLPYLSQVYEQAKVAKEQAVNYTRLQHTVLKLGVMCTVAPTHLIDVIHSLQRRDQGIELQVLDSSARELQDRLIKGELEVALYCFGGGEQNERLHYMPLFREQFMIVVAQGHRLAMRDAVACTDLDGERYLNRVNCEFNGYAGPIWRECGATIKMVYRSERDDWILAMIAAGLGFGFMPEYSVNHPGVVARRLVEPEFWREVNLVTVRGRPHSPAVGSFVREAMRTAWIGRPALAVTRAAERLHREAGAQ
jgi:LysR family transcriptional regulator, hydrogen peroxide-inducible genes activator